MAFDKKKFLQAKFTPREEAVSVPDMKGFFLNEKEIDELNKIDARIMVEAKGPKRDAIIIEKQVFLSKTIWKVRGLEGVEVARSNEAMERNKNIAAILEGLIAKNMQNKVQAVKQLIGVDEKVPNEIAKRIELLIIGSIDPKVDTELAVKICRVYPIEFYQITNKITELTGRGHVPGKPKPCGKTQKSK